MQKPKVFVAENVKGLLTANKKKPSSKLLPTLKIAVITFRRSCITLQNLAYLNFVNVCWLSEYVWIQDLIFAILTDAQWNWRKRLKPYVTAGHTISNIPQNASNNELLKISDKTRRMLELIPEGGNFTDIPKDHPYMWKVWLATFIVVCIGTSHQNNYCSRWRWYLGLSLPWTACFY